MREKPGMGRGVPGGLPNDKPLLAGRWEAVPLGLSTSGFP